MTNPPQHPDPARGVGEYPPGYGHSDESTMRFDATNSGYQGAEAAGPGYVRQGYGPGYTNPAAPYTAQQPYSAVDYGVQQGGTPPCPPTNVGWAVAAILFFWPLAFTAMSRAYDVFPLWSMGRYSEAQAASDTAKRLGVISLWLIVGLTVVYVLFLLFVVSLSSTMTGSSRY